MGELHSTPLWASPRFRLFALAFATLASAFQATGDIQAALRPLSAFAHPAPVAPAGALRAAFLGEAARPLALLRAHCARRAAALGLALPAVAWDWLAPDRCPIRPAPAPAQRLRPPSAPARPAPVRGS